LRKPDRERVQRGIEAIQGELEVVTQQIPQWDREHREARRKLNRNTTGAAIALMMDELRAGYCDFSDVAQHLAAGEQGNQREIRRFLDPGTIASARASATAGSRFG
jgi:hypothetical protein